MCWVWSTGRELCIPACAARLTGATGLGLTSDCGAIPSFSGQSQRAEPTTPMRTRSCPCCKFVVSLHTWTSCTECPWEWHSTYAGNILHEIIYVVLANRGTVNSRVQDLWPLIVEAYRLGSATTRLGGLKGSSRLHQVFPQLKAKAKETEWFCRALTLVLPQFNGQADQCHRHTLYASAAGRVVFHAPEAIDHCTEHAGTLQLVA